MKEIFSKDIVFVSGLTRSGKSLVLPIVASLSNSDKASADFFLEQIPFAVHIGAIDSEIALNLIRTGMNLKIYDDFVGRNLNHKNGDFTDINLYQDPKKYLLREMKQDNTTENYCNRQGSFLPFMIHNAILSSEIWFKSINNLKIIHTQRSPVEIVFSWHMKGYGNYNFSGTRSNTLTYSYKSIDLPYYMKGYEKNFIELDNDVDRIIFFIKVLRDKSKKVYEKSSNKDRILFVKHSDFLNNPSYPVNKICNFLGQSQTLFTKQVLSRENCPRVSSKQTPFATSSLEKKQKILQLRQICSEKSYTTLLEMEEEFTNKNNSI